MRVFCCLSCLNSGKSSRSAGSTRMADEAYIFWRGVLEKKMPIMYGIIAYGIVVVMLIIPKPSPLLSGGINAINKVIADETTITYAEPCRILNRIMRTKE